MKKAIAKYLGMEGKEFVFSSKRNMRLKFSKCCSDMIRKYDLLNNRHVNQAFLVEYHDIANKNMFKQPTLIISKLSFFSGSNTFE
jgi:hypothetical protein